MNTDSIADLLTRIRNAAMVRHASVVIPSSNFKKAVAEKLSNEGYVGEVEEVANGEQRSLVIRLKYDQFGQSVIEGLERVSRPGRRVYARANGVPRVRSGLGTVLISTNRGIMTGAEARASGNGGEIICRVW